MKKTTLYKKDSKGKIRFVTLSHERNKLIKETGLIGGKTVIHTRVCHAKNEGKANATTAEEQAASECHSAMVKKLKEGYFDTKDAAMNNTVTMPMLAHKYDSNIKKVDSYLADDNLVCQPKLDGIRARITKDGKMFSRKNREIDTMDHILQALKGIDLQYELDGELYIHGKTFQEVTSLVKKETENSKDVVFHVYDVYDDSNGYKTRHRYLTDALSNVPNVEVVPYEEAKSKSNIKAYAELKIKQGYEGIMLRETSSPYVVNKRSFSLLKYKLFEDVSLPIIDVTPDEARPTYGTIWVKDGKSIQKLGMKGSKEEREEILRNKEDYIGLIAEVRYFEKTDSGKLRHSYYHGIRIDK